MNNLRVNGIVLLLLLFFTTASFAQIFGKGQPGFVVLNDGNKLEGFVKKGASTNGKLSSIYYSDNIIIIL